MLLDKLKEGRRFTYAQFSRIEVLTAVEQVIKQCEEDLLAEQSVRKRGTRATRSFKSRAQEEREKAAATVVHPKAVLCLRCMSF
jgi:hypothetical protein